MKREADVIVSTVSLTSAISESLMTPFAVGISMSRISSRLVNLPAVRTVVFLCLPMTSPTGLFTFACPKIPMMVAISTLRSIILSLSSSIEIWRVVPPKMSTLATPGTEVNSGSISSSTFWRSSVEFSGPVNEIAMMAAPLMSTFEIIGASTASGKSAAASSILERTSFAATSTLMPMLNMATTIP